MKHKFPNSFNSDAFLLMVLLLCGINLSATGQESPPQAAFRFANAAAITGKVLLTIDTAKLRPDGFGPGDKTGVIGILAGTHRLSASTTGSKPAEANVTFPPNSAMTIVSFTKPVTDPLTRKTVNQLQLFSQTDPAREKGKHFYLLYVSGRPSINLVVNGQSETLTTLRSFKANAGGAIKVEYQGKPVMEFVAQESGTFLVIIFDKPDGTIGGMMLPDYG